MFSRKLLKQRRGGTLTVAVVSLSMSLITIGVEMDAGRLFVARHQDQIISDSATMAGSSKIPRTAEAQAAVDLIVAKYREAYNTSFIPTTVITTNASGLATGVRVSVGEPVPMFLPNMMGASTRSTSTAAAANRVIPGALLAGAVPIGVQYDTVFSIPANGYASDAETSLKIKTKTSDLKTPGNAGALRFSGDNSGSSQWSTYLKYGFTSRIAVGDYITPKTGNMMGPTEDAIALSTDGGDTDSRFARAEAYPWNDDTYSKFDTNNPRIIALPLVDWAGAKGSSTDVPVKGFAAFYITRLSGADIYGRFIRYTVDRDGKNT